LWNIHCSRLDKDNGKQGELVGHGGFSLFLFLEGFLLRGLFDSWGDFWSGLKDLGEQQAQEKIQSRFATDHISAQNDAVAEMGRLLDRFHSSHSRDYPQIESDIQSIAANFTHYASTFNTERARRGAREVSQLGNQIVSDLEAERLGYRSPGGGTSILAGLPDWALPVGLLAGAYFLFKRKR